MNFDEIYQAFSPKIFRVCLGYLNDRDKAKDMTQETFITVWQNLDKFREEAQVSTWIYKIATNKCLRQIETDGRQTKTELPVQLKHEEPEQDTEQKHIFLQKCIAELPEMERLIIGLYLEDLPQEKIAEVTGISHANVRVKIHRIKEKLTQKFMADGQF